LLYLYLYVYYYNYVRFGRKIDLNVLVGGRDSVVGIATC
jgi:hypothetical protein